MVWYVDPVQRTVQVFTGLDQALLLHEGDNLSGEPVLPGFILPLRDLFARLGA